MNQINFDTIKDQLMKSCIVNGGIGSLQEIEEMGVIEFGKRAKLYMPTKLYKYYSNLDTMLPDASTVNYSQQALINNTVYMQTPTAFDDVYDSDIIDICKRRNIPYVGVKRNPKLFEMQDCEVLCENCSNFLSIKK